MHPLDDVRLIESEILTPPIISAGAQDQQTNELSHSQEALVCIIGHETMIGSHHWQRRHENHLWPSGLILWLLTKSHGLESH